MAEQRALDAPQRQSLLPDYAKRSVPLFVKKEPVQGDSIWKQHARYRALSRDGGANNSRSGSIDSLHSAWSAPPSEKKWSPPEINWSPPPSENYSVTGPAAGGNWMQPRGKGIGLMKAYAVTGNGLDGRPRSADSVTAELTHTGTLYGLSRFRSHQGTKIMEAQKEESEFDEFDVSARRSEELRRLRTMVGQDIGVPARRSEEIQRPMTMDVQDLGVSVRQSEEVRRPKTMEEWRAENPQVPNYGHGRNWMDAKGRKERDNAAWLAILAAERVAEAAEVEAEVAAEAEAATGFTLELPSANPAAPAYTFDEPAPEAAMPPARTANWHTAGRSQGMDLATAWAMAGAQETIEYKKPKTAEWVEKQSVSPSRIPVRSSPDNDIANAKPSPPKVIKDMFARAERDYNNNFAQPQSPSLLHPDYVSSMSSEGPQPGSPSPADRTSKTYNPTFIVTADPKPRAISFAQNRHELDLKRRARMLANPAPFVKKPYEYVPAGRRIAEAKKALEEQKAASDACSNSTEDGRKGSVSSYDDVPEPPLNIPLTWREKRRAQTPVWVRKIISPDVSSEIKHEIESINVQYEQQVDIAMPTIELASEPTPPSSRPASAQPDNGAFDQKSYLQPWDADVDFTAQSDLVTSPQLKIRPSSLDEVREREIQSLTARALATSRLEEIRERNSEERSFTPEPHMPIQQENTPDSTGIQKFESHEYQQANEDEHDETMVSDVSIVSGGGIRIRGTPVTIYPAEAYAAKFGNLKENDRPSHSREDSFDALKKLSRLSSKSPSTSPNEEKQEPIVSRERKYPVEERKEPLITHERKNHTEGKKEPLFTHARKNSIEEIKNLVRSSSQSPATSPTEDKKFEVPETRPVEKKEARVSGSKKPEVYHPRRTADVERILAKSRERQRERSRSESVSEDTPQKPHEPGHKAPSDTEKMTENPKQKQVAEKQPEEASYNGKGLEVDVESKRRSGASSPPKSDVDPEERITAERLLFEPRDDKSERNSIRAPSRSPSPSEDGNYDETPRPNKPDPLSLPTPQVIGAFINTPAPTMRKLKSQRSVSPNHEFVEDPFETQNNDRGHLASQERPSGSASRVTQPNPEAPQSASSQRPHLVNTVKRATAAEDLRRIRLEENIEDSTTSSFDNLLENEAADPNAMDQTAIIDLEFDNNGHPLSDAEKERRLELIHYERMNRRLKNTTSSLRDARHGIERLEHEVTISPSGKAKTLAAGPNCNCHELTIKIKIPKLYTKTAQPTSGRNWKLTWFGFILALFASWFVAESLTCGVYCKPAYSSHNYWDPSDPSFGVAVPTKLDQVFGGVVGGALWAGRGAVLDWLDPERHRRPLRPAWMCAGGPVGIVDSSSSQSWDEDEYL